MSDLDLPDLNAQQMTVLLRLRDAYGMNIRELRRVAATPHERKERKALEEHLADAINLMQGCVYTVSHAISNSEARERTGGAQ